MATEPQTGARTTSGWHRIDLILGLADYLAIHDNLSGPHEKHSTKPLHFQHDKGDDNGALFGPVYRHLQCHSIAANERQLLARCVMISNSDDKVREFAYGAAAVSLLAKLRAAISMSECPQPP
jgi:hypothetical protein